MAEEETKKTTRPKPPHKHWTLMTMTVVSVVGLIGVGFIAFNTNVDNNESDDPPKAVSKITVVQNADSTTINTHNYSTARRLYNQGEYQQALDILDELSTKISPDDLVAVNELYALIYEQTGDTDLAKDSYVKLLQDFESKLSLPLEDYDIGLLYQLGELNEKSGNTQEAISIYQDFIDRVSNFEVLDESIEHDLERATENLERLSQ